MSGLSICALRMPSTPYRVDLRPSTGDTTRKFEKEEQSRAEDSIRAKLARTHAAKASSVANAEAARALARLLEYDEHGRDWPDSLASSAYMRDQRIRVVGALWQRVDEDRLPLSTVTISLPATDYAERMLSGFCPDSDRQRLRGWLNRCGAIDARGWGCFFLHCDWEPLTQTYRFHYHGVVAGEMIEVLDKLREEPAFKPIKRKVGEQIKRYPRIRMSRAPIEDVPGALGYLLKSYWPQKWEGEIEGEAKRQARHSRIQGPAHTRALLWLNRYRLDQISLLTGLRVERSGLRATKLGHIHERKGEIT